MNTTLTVSCQPSESLSAEQWDATEAPRGRQLRLALAESIDGVAATWDDAKGER